MGVTENCLEVAINDAVNRTYAKLVLSDDAKTLLGGVLVGDASSYGVLRPMVGSELPGDPLALIAPAQADGAAALGVGALPDSAQICSCNNVTKGDLKGAIASGCADVPALKSCTAAGTSCGSCVPLLKQLLEAEGVEQSKALCEHFSQSRAELFEIIAATEIRTFSGLWGMLSGGGKGCDICKPVVASILASTGSDHILDGEQASLQDSNDHFLANIQKNGSYSVVPRVPGGDIKPEHLILIGQIAQDFGLYTKITGGQRIDLFGARVDQLPQIWKRLVDGGMESGHAYGKALRTVKSCVGSDWCRYGQQDSVQLAIDLELRYRGLRAPHKIKLGVSGCARECAEARGKDVGVIATEKGWNLYVGGNGGMTPKHAQLLASDLDTETLVRYVDRFRLVLHPDGRSAAAHRAVGRIAGRRPGSRARGRVRRLAGPGRRIRGRNGAACAELQVRMEGRAGGPGQAVAVRLLRQRPDAVRRLDGDIHRACRAQSACAHRHPAGPLEDLRRRQGER